MARRIVLSLSMLAFSLALMTLLATGFGALRLPVTLLWSGHDEALRKIWLTIRLPRVLLAGVTGGSLALAGCVMQGLFRNPLADRIVLLHEGKIVSQGAPDLVLQADDLARWYGAQVHVGLHPTSATPQVFLAP